ncbi:hypothetical protein [Streptomyces sp. NBC_01207]|uniref:hypothetical protein n=1 Tax=Streptomyces sp. NBC_01207 TaxID=2903772 RepID=UPI002E0FA205|nr:hypothetical protein OG457_27160 [Streptomyces sp. NBC_01207]
MNHTPRTLPGPVLAGLRLFHGGLPGLGPGDLLAPHPPAVMDGCRTCEAKARGEQPFVAGVGVVDPLTERPDRVYVTTERAYAAWYAAKYPPRGGALYVVEAVGAVDRSTEDRFPTWAVEAARVRSVVDPVVQMTPAQRRGLWRRWERLDFAANPAKDITSRLANRQAAADPDAPPEARLIARMAAAAWSGKARQ